MHQRTNYMKFIENLWARTLDLKIQVKQTEEKIPCLFDYFQAVDKEWNKSVLYLGICLGLLNPMENNQRYHSNLLRCHTSHEQRIIPTFESNAFLTLKPAMWRAAFSKKRKYILIIRSDVRAALDKEV